MGETLVDFMNTPLGLVCCTNEVSTASSSNELCQKNISPKQRLIDSQVSGARYTADPE